MHSGNAITAPSPVTTVTTLAPPHVDPVAVPKPHFTVLSQIWTSEPQITSLGGQSYEVLLCGNKAAKRIWTLLTTGQILILLCAICCLFGDTGVSQQPAFLLFFHLPHFFLRGPGVCSTITAARKGKLVPCVWWRAAALVTRYNHGGFAAGIHLLTLGGKAAELELLSPSLCHFVLLPRPSPSVSCRRTADSSDKPLKKCGMGPTSISVATVFWCFGSLLHSDSKRRGVAPSFYCFQRVSANGKS